VAEINGRFVSLLPEHLSQNNAREADAFDDGDQETKTYLINKPDGHPPFMKEQIFAGCAKIAEVAAELPAGSSILFVFSGGGMEAHLSGLLGENVVLADISMPLHRIASARFEHHNVPQPGAFVSCDAERLPFKTDSFDYVIGFEGIHHCLVPQAALAEIWRVARHRALIVDNYECALTRFMSRFGRSSMVEDSGVKPNRFTRNALETMMFNAGIEDYLFTPRTSIPPSVQRLGYWLPKVLTWILDTIGQPNMFMLITKARAGQKVVPSH
jgi:ubiquinone/menaquinone biosynthesis C-methylase UbiE